jgi:thymidylate synthase
MHELFVTADTLPNAYHAALLALHDKHDVSAAPDYNTRQKEASLTFVVENPLAEPMISKFFIGDPKALEQYRQEMLDGILDFEVERGNWEYTYHLRMANQFDWILDELRRNPDSRRAIISVRDEEDLKSGNPACLQSVHYLLRNGKLHCKVLFRSNDATKAAYMNAFALVCLQKRFADALNVPVGSYTHRANSFHVYERDWAMFDGYVKRIKSDAETAFSYIGDWDELMDEAKPAIAEMAKKLFEQSTYSQNG